MNAIDPFAMDRLIQSANLAPSILNTKPWQFERVAADRVNLMPDWTRRLRVIDPLHRELFISCGAALFNVRLAIRVAGHERNPQLIVLQTLTNEAPDWLRLGQALQRLLLLTATWFSADASFLTQSIEAADRAGRGGARQLWPWPRTTQMIIRVGQDDPAGG